jgi:hypothetical protein
MLRATNMLRGNKVLGRVGFEEALDQYLCSFSAHQTSLFPRGRSNSTAQQQVPQNVPCNGRPSMNRLQSKTELFCRTRSGAPKHRSCGFCLEDGHTVNQCTLMGKCGNQVSHSDKDQFCYGILDNFAVKQLNHCLHPSRTILSHVIGATHISIVSLFAASARNASTNVINKRKNRELGVQQVIAHIKLLGEGGSPISVDL